jgi:hypothetical protein
LKQEGEREIEQDHLNSSKKQQEYSLFLQNPPKPFYYSRGEFCSNKLLQDSQEQNGKEAQ